MPEDPELARSRDRLKQLLVGKYVHSIAGLDGGRYGLNGEELQGLEAWCAEVSGGEAHWNDGQLVKEIGVKGKFNGSAYGLAVLKDLGRRLMEAYA